MLPELVNSVFSRIPYPGTQANVRVVSRHLDVATRTRGFLGNCFTLATRVGTMSFGA